MNNILRKLKIPALCFVLLVAFSSMYARTKSLPKTPKTISQNKATFRIFNQTNIGVTLELQQFFKNKFSLTKEGSKSSYFKPKETKTMSIPIKIDPADQKIVGVIASTYPKDKTKFDKITHSLQFDATQLANTVIEGVLQEGLFRSSDELWPPVEPTPIILLKIVKSKKARTPKS